MYLPANARQLTGVQLSGLAAGSRTGSQTKPYLLPVDQVSQVDDTRRVYPNLKIVILVSWRRYGW